MLQPRLVDVQEHPVDALHLQRHVIGQHISDAAGYRHLKLRSWAHRSHEAMFIDKLLSKHAAYAWGICGVGILPQDRAMHEALHAQDCLYTLVVKQADGTIEPRVIGSIVDHLYAPDDPRAVIERLAAPKTRIVSLTITEGDDNLDPLTGEFDARNDAVLRDLAPGAVPTTVFGLLIAALVLRRERDMPPFTVMSCHNIQGNGGLAGRMFAAFARLVDPELGDWVEQHVRFPNSMVDRITPVTTDNDRAALAARSDIADRWPVVCEPYAQWVLEDDFGGERPPFEKCGVHLVADTRTARRLLPSARPGRWHGELQSAQQRLTCVEDELFRALTAGERATLHGLLLRAGGDQLPSCASNPEADDEPGC